MQHIEYSIGLSKVKFSYARGLIEYKGKNFTEIEITGFGIGTNITELLKKSEFQAISKDIDLQNLDQKITKKTDDILVIAYKKPHEETIRGLNIPLNLSDPLCIDFLEKLKKDMRSKYIGVGNYQAIVKELKISQKGLCIIIFIIIITTIIIGSFLSSKFTY